MGVFYLGNIINQAKFSFPSTPSRAGSGCWDACALFPQGSVSSFSLFSPPEYLDKMGCAQMKAVLAVFLTHFIHDPVDVMNPLRLQWTYNEFHKMSITVSEFFTKMKFIVMPCKIIVFCQNIPKYTPQAIQSVGILYNLLHGWKSIPPALNFKF